MENNSQFDNNLESESEQLSKYLAFKIGNEIYGIYVKILMKLLVYAPLLLYQMYQNLLRV